MTLMLVLAGCTQNKSAMDNFYKVYGSGMEDMVTALELISTQKIYFGHQSVGYDLLSGMEQWEEETGVRINKVETRDFSKTEGATLVHFRVGENRDPYSKIEDFAAMVQQIPKDEPSLAFFKFCYIDFQPSADVDAIFRAYKEKMLALRDSSGNCRIVLCTVPVTAIQKGPKALAKKILGMPLIHARENIKRGAFSERIRAEMSDEFPVFDLARVESTLPDGTTQTYKYQGKRYPRLPNSYTRDRGHLNPDGAKIVAFNFIAFLSEL
jgi:hypothetical protein